MAPLIRSPAAVRPWQHVLDPLHGYILLAEALVEKGATYAKAWNFGPDKDCQITVQSLVEHLAKHWDSAVSWEYASGVQPHETASRYLDSTLARTQLDWKPCWSLDECVHHTVFWWKSFLRSADMRRETLRQIELFESITVEPA
jgi:CDP-glucose 4,6-dehydratase